MKKNLLLLLLLAGAVKCGAQTVFEDASGESILLKNESLKDWFNIRINTAAESFSLSYIGTKDLGTKPYKNSATEKVLKTRMLGFDLKLKVKDGIGSLYKEGKLNTGITGTFIVGLQKENFDIQRSINTRPRSFYLKAGLSYDKFTMLDTALVQKSDLKKFQPFASVNKNWFCAGKTPGGNNYYTLFGVSLGYKMTNNTESLDDGIGATPLKSTPSYAVIKQDAGKIGIYQTYHSFPLRVDYGVLPRLFGKNVIGLNAYARGRFNEPKTPVNFGTGLFFAKDKEPTNVIGGFGWQFNDVFNKPGLASNSSVFVYIGYTIQ